MGSPLKLGIVIGASLGSGFSSIFNNAKKSLGSIGDEAKRISQTKLNITEFQRLSKSAGDNKIRLDSLGNSLRKAGIDMNNLGKESQRLSNALDKMKFKKEQVDAHRAAVDDAKGSYLGLAAGIYGTYRTAKKLIDAEGGVERAQGAIASLGIPESGVQSITIAAEAFSSKWAGTTTDAFIRASYDIRSGISTLGDTAVGEFTRIAALTAGATLSTTEEMTTMFSKGYAIYRDEFDSFGKSVISGWAKMSQEEKDIEFGKYFSAGISSTVRAFRTKGGEMSAALSNLGNVASSAGVSFSDQLAILGTLQSTFSGSESSTKFRSFIKNASSGGRELGMNFVNYQTGMLKSIPEILDQVSAHFGGKIDDRAKERMTKAFGDDEAMQFISTLINKRESLTKGSGVIKKSLSGGLDLTIEMATENQRGKALELLGQKTNNLAASIGKILTPAANAAAASIGGLFQLFQGMIEKCPVAAGVIFSVGAAIGGLMAAHKVFTLLKLGLALLKAEFIATKIAFMSNPIGLAIGILILAAGLIITYWEPIKTFFAGVWGKIKSIFFGVVNWMKSFWSSLGPGIKNGLATIGTVLFPFMGMPVLIIKNWSKIKGLFSGLWDFIKSVWKPVADFFSDLWDKVKDSFLHPIDELKQKWQSFKDFFTGIWETIKHPLGGPTLPTLNYPAPTFPTMGTHQLSFVGVGSPAIPDFQIPPAKASNTTTINAPITINAHPGMDAHAVAKEVDRKFRERESQAAARNRGALHD